MHAYEVLLKKKKKKRLSFIGKVDTSIHLQHHFHFFFFFLF